MRSYITVALLCASMSASLWGELQQKQLTKDISMQYQEMQQKGDDSKREIIIKDPHFFWMDTSSMKPEIAGEIDHKGTFTIDVNFAENRIKVEPDGTTHVIIASGNSEEKPIDFTVEGKRVAIINLDFDKIAPTLEKLKNGDTSEQNILVLLNAIKSVAGEAKDLKVIASPQERREPLLVDLAKFNYVHTSGQTPEEISLQLKTKQKLEYFGSSAIYSLPAIGPIDSNYDIIIRLPEWAKLIAYARAPKMQFLPEVSLEVKTEAQSKLGQGVWNGNLFSKNSEGGRSIASQFHYEGKSNPDWVQQVQNIVKEHSAQGENNQRKELHDAMEVGLYNWLKSPKTTPFLKLFPMQLTSDWKGAMQYAMDAGNFSVGKADFDYSLLGKEKKGLKVLFDYQNGDVNSQVTLVGGRPILDYGIDLYNSFSDSIADLWPMRKISKEMGEGLYKLLVEYVEQPAKAQDELMFIVKYNKDGFTIGKKSLAEMMSDLSTFQKKYLSQKNDEIDSIQMESVEIEE